MINNNFENEENYGETIIKMFRENKVDFDKLLSKKNTPVPEGSSFYDGTIEEIWEDPLKNKE